MARRSRSQMFFTQVLIRAAMPKFYKPLAPGTAAGIKRRDIRLEYPAFVLSGADGIMHV